jgi:hypothetical protein
LLQPSFQDGDVVSFEVTDQWIIDTMLKNDWCLNAEIFVYAQGIEKRELNAPTGEKVVASITNVVSLPSMH